MRKRILILVLILVGAMAMLPYVIGKKCKQAFMEQIATYQKLYPQNLKFDSIDYQMGYLKSTAKIVLTLTDTDTTHPMPPLKFHMNAVINHGPIIYDQIKQSFDLAYGEVYTSIHLPDLVHAFIPDKPEGFLQINSIIPFDGKTWEQSYRVPALIIGGMVNWAGLTGNLTIIYENANPIKVAGKVVFGALNVNLQASMAPIPELYLQPLTYEFNATQKTLNVWVGSSVLTGKGFTVKLHDNQTIAGANLLMNSTYGLNNNNLYFYDSTASLESLSLPPYFPVTSIAPIKKRLIVNNLNPQGLQNYMNEVAEADVKVTDREFKEIMGILTPTSTLEFGTDIKTNLGIALGDLKLFLQALPTNEEELKQNINVDVNAKIAIPLLDQLVAAYFTAPPTAGSQDLINSWIQQGYIVKGPTDYSITFSKRMGVFLLNGKDVSGEINDLYKLN